MKNPLNLTSMILFLILFILLGCSSKQPLPNSDHADIDSAQLAKVRPYLPPNFDSLSNDDKVGVLNELRKNKAKVFTVFDSTLIAHKNYLLGFKKGDSLAKDLFGDLAKIVYRGKPSATLVNCGDVSYLVLVGDGSGLKAITYERFEVVLNPESPNKGWRYKYDNFTTLSQAQLGLGNFYDASGQKFPDKNKVMACIVVFKRPGEETDTSEFVDLTSNE